MRPFARAIAVAVAIAVFAPVQSASADGDDPIVVRVGTESLTRTQLARRLAKIPAIQLATFGRDATTIRRAFVDKVVVPELLLAQGAKAKNAGELPEVRQRLLDARRASVMEALKKEVEASLSPEDVTRYYETNRDKFQTPERLNLWRILVRSREEAMRVLDDVKKPDGEKKWKDLARERSTDKATNERGGNLGFVGPDGQSNEVTVKVDPKLFEAARKVKDGELVPQPVAEGEAFAVLWRRGSTPAVSRPLEQELGTIRVTLAKQRTETRVKELVEQLRKEQVRDVAADLVALVEVSAMGEVGQRKRPGVGKPKAPGKPQPSAGTLR